MQRFSTLLLALNISAAAQTRNPRPLIPITGRVLNAATGDPIPGAIVHYRGSGNAFDQNNRAISPTTLQGDVTAGPDGAYATPPLPAFGDFTIRASAPGFFAAKDWLQAIPARLRDNSPPPLPPGFVPPPGYKPPPPHDGTLRLQPDPIGLQPMSDAALAAFALPGPGLANRNFHAAAFSPDGNRLAFLTVDTFSPPLVGDVVQTPFRRCAIWIYDLKAGKLSAAVDESPSACDSPAILWDGENFYIPIPAQDPSQAATPLGEFIQGPSDYGPRPLPAPIRQKLAQIEAQAAAAQKLGSYSPGGVTPDGLFAVSVDMEGRSSCGSLTVTNSQTHRTRTLGVACVDASFLMLDGDRILYISGNHAEATTGKLVDYNPRTGAHRDFDLPAMNHAPQLLTHHSLPGGATRIAYTMKGDCDPAASDYSQPSQPDGALGNTPNQFSVCFVTIPPIPPAPTTPNPPSK